MSHYIYTLGKGSLGRVSLGTKPVSAVDHVQFVYSDSVAQAVSTHMCHLHLSFNKLGKWQNRLALDGEGAPRGRHKRSLIIFWPILLTLFL
jgi:hypothetical protein